MWGVTRNRIRAAGTLAAAALLLSTTAACDLLGSDEPPPPPPVINSYVTGLQVLGDTGATQEVVNDALPAGTATGPAAEVNSDTTVVNGGSVQQSITSSTPFKQVRIALEELRSGTTPSGSPARGFHQVTFSAEKTDATVVLTIAQALPGQEFKLYFAAVSASGEQGLVATQDVVAEAVGTGQVQVSVSWDVDSDLDLHVIDPSGEEIYWGSEVSTSGGELDLDSNAGCSIDGTRNENITWADAAPAGTYTVRIDLWSSCDVEPTNYVVTIQVAGQSTRTFTGSIPGEGDQGGEGDGVEVATFEVTAAPA